MAKPLISIIGRQNVGKSTLFNRLLGKRKAIVDEKPGVTRDFNYGDVDWCGEIFSFVDTGGLFGYDSKIGIMEEISLILKNLLDKSSAVVFLVDGKSGLNPGDKFIADILRKSGLKVILTVNKVDNPSSFGLDFPFYELGFGDPLVISAAQGFGIGELLDAVKNTTAGIIPKDSQKSLKITIAGRPNVGKSSLMNAFLNRKRSIVHSEPGTTRDPVSESIKYHGLDFQIVDTAGYRRMARVESSIEYYSIKRAWDEYRGSGVTLLVADASQGFVRGDWRVLKEIEQTAGGIVICLNKTDLVDPQMRESLLKKVKFSMKSRSFIPVMLVSALRKTGVSKLVAKIYQIYNTGEADIDPDRLNSVLLEAVVRHHPPMIGTKRVNIYSFELVRKLPHIITAKTNIPEGIPEPYLKYIEKSVRSEFDLEGVIVKIRPEKKNKK
ncbi:ribosome biogenesis GTPase Der [candidate division WOR-3 bacterium]|nr:ribosome biogenesis GTPase Der [candidate division WOR-3 bacterium]